MGSKCKAAVTFGAAIALGLPAGAQTPPAAVDIGVIDVDVTAKRLDAARSAIQPSLGATTYSFRHRLFTLLDSITSFSETPLYFVFYLGLAVLLASAAIGGWLLWLKLTGEVLAGWVSTLLSVWFLGGLAIFSIGVVGLYISRIFIETKRRPYTIVRKLYGGGADPLRAGPEVRRD